MGIELTRRQRDIVEFIQQAQAEDGVTPSQSEIAARFGFRSPATVTSHLRLIRAKGFLAASDGRIRSLRVMSPLGRFRAAVAEIPLLGAIPAGLPEDREQSAEGCVRVDVATLGFKPTRNTFALRVSGDSMIGAHILPGDIVVMEHGPEPRDGQIVAALIDGTCTLKTFVFHKRKPFLRAENPKYPELTPVEELTIQGVFRALIRHAKDAA